MRIDRRARRRRRRIFYLCTVFFVLLVAALIVWIIRLLPTKAASDSSSSAPSVSESSAPADPVESEPSVAISGSAGESSTGESSTQESSAPPAVPDGYELLPVSEEALHQGALILVNKTYAYEFPASQDLISMYDLTDGLYSVSGTDVMMDAVAAQPLDNLLSDFYATTGIGSINILCGYRTLEESQELFDASAEQNGLEHAERYVMRPGYSEHHSALSADLGILLDGGGLDYYYPTDSYAWITEHAADYGFILRYPEDKTQITDIDYEAWHFRYVGFPHAQAMNELGFCLEEYIDFLKQYTVEGEHYTVGSYEIYYVPAAESIPVPTGRSYEVSGNNVDGFIVTVGGAA